MKVKKRKYEMEECNKSEVEWKNAIKVKLNGRMQ